MCGEQQSHLAELSLTRVPTQTPPSFLHLSSCSTDILSQITMLASALVLTSAFAPQAPLSAHTVASARVSGMPTMSLQESRRAAVLSGVSLAALATMPRVALADENEDVVAAIAARTMQKNEIEKQKKAAEVAKRAAKLQKDGARENEGADLLVKGGIAASFFLSLPFFYKNLARLGLKFSSVVNKNIKEEDFRR